MANDFSARQPRRKYCQFCKENTEFIDYKDTQLLRKYMTDRGKIKPRRVTGACTQHQHDIANAIKRDVVEVAQGYAENFLFPKKLAVAATKGNLKQLDERRNNIAKREAVRLATANETKAAFEGKTVTVDVKVGDEGILFGSVTAAMIADAIKAQLGMDIDRKRVELGKPIKVAGAHTVAISLYREIKAEVVVLVGVTAEAEVEEAAEVAEAETAEVETEAAAE